MQNDLQQRQLDQDSQVFLKALLHELEARDELSRIVRELKTDPSLSNDDNETYRNLCIARRSIQLAERKHYRAYRKLIRHFEL